MTEGDTQRTQGTYSAQAWINMARGAHNFVAVTPRAVRIASLGAEELTIAWQRVNAGDAVEEVIGDRGTTIRFKDIVIVLADEHQQKITIRWFWKSVFHPEIDIVCLTASDREHILAALREHLEPEFRFRRTEYGRFRAAMSPVFAGIFVLASIRFFWAVAADRPFLFGLRPQPSTLSGLVLCWLVRELGATGVLLLGAIALARVAMWLVSRVRKPPTVVTLRRRLIGRSKETNQQQQQ